MCKPDPYLDLGNIKNRADEGFAFVYERVLRHRLNHSFSAG